MRKSEEWEMEDENIPEDERTFRELRKIANSLVLSIQFTTDFPSNNVSGMVPCLDVQMYSQDDCILYRFFENR